MPLQQENMDAKEESLIISLQQRLDQQTKDLNEIIEESVLRNEEYLNTIKIHWNSNQKLEKRLATAKNKWSEARRISILA